MNTSVFNPDMFLGTEITAQLDTVRQPLPDGDYLGIIEEVEKPMIINTDNGQLIKMNVRVKLETPELGESHGFTSTKRNYGILLDINQYGVLDTSKGKNVQLGKLREAVGQNTSSAWTPGQLVGQTAKFRVKTSINKKTQQLVDNIIDASAINQ